MRGLLIPPVFGSSAVAGTLTSCRTSSLVSEARSDSLPFWSFLVKPGASVGTMNPRMDLSLASSPVFAHTIETCAVDPDVGYLRYQFFRKSSLDVAVADDGQNFPVYERTNRIANRALLFEQRTVDVIKISWHH